MSRFLIIFTVSLAALFSVEMLVPVQEHVIVPFTELLARLSAAIVLPFDDTVIAYGKILQFRDTGFAVSIEAGCNGVEATIVLIAAVVAYPASWKSRVIAIAIGFLAIQALNLVRIISLFYLGNWDTEIFSWIHLYLWPSLIMLDVLIVFIVYLRYLARQSQPVQASAG